MQGQYKSLAKVINLLSELVVFNNVNFDQFLKSLIKIITEIVSVDSCLIYFYDREKNQLILIGSKKPHLKDIGHIILKQGEGITGWAAQHKKAVVLESQAYLDPRFKAFKQLPEDKYESFLSVPIIDQSGVVGVINLQNKAPLNFLKVEIETIESLVKIIASAFTKVALDRKVNNLERKLEERKIIEKAKGVLMKQKNMTEEEAYSYIRKEAMIKRKSMKEIAVAILLVF